jgi:hypothetical protein
MGEGLGDAAGKANRLLVRCPVAGYRRGGRAWPLGETEVGFAEFSDEQVGQLLADPRLIVVVIAGAD